MRVDRLTLKDFTVFREADFEFSPGLNVFIGANGTGKSHVLKVLYSILRPLASTRKEIEFPGPGFGMQPDLMWTKLFAVFRPSPTSPADPDRPYESLAASLTRHGAKGLQVDVGGDFGDVELGVRHGAIPKWRAAPGPMPSGLAVFVPTAEALSVYEGFIAAYERRELSFDQTYRDLCVDLSATPLRSVSPPALAELAAEFENAVGGKTVLRGNRFYVSVSEDWLLEAPMLAEGLRKLAAIAHLIRNGSLSENSVLFWDEPEANINPKLIVTIAQALLALAGAGIQVFVATHDFLLSNELSLAAEYETPEAKKAAPRFFALSKPNPTAPVEVEWGATLADLSHNPILEEFAAHYDRERDLFYGPAARKGE
jgi:energy-coupling factor transporter ATP-binding protein EcfA2